MQTTKSIPPWQSLHDELGVSPPPLDDRPLGSYIEKYARVIPSNTALRYRDRDISYAELDRWANRLANALVEHGVGRDAVVGIHLPNIPQYVIALIAISKIGCAGSGVSPLLAPGELVFQIEDAGISVLLSLDSLAQAVLAPLETLPACLQTVIITAADDCLTSAKLALPSLPQVDCVQYLTLLEDSSIDFNQREVDWNDTFMIQYTGGTTGRPKGALLSVRNLMYNLLMWQVYQPWEIGEETLATAFPLFHAAGLSMVLAGLRFGARIPLIPDARDIEHLCQQMKACPPTRMAAVPTLYQMLVAHPASQEVDFSKLKAAVTGAAPLTGGDRARIEGLIGEDKLGDVFGMTETGPVHVVNPPTQIQPDAVGIPLPGAETRIVDLDTGTKEMPQGEAGEIITSGPHVMKGYRYLPDESAVALRQWRDRTWMYTGDVGYMDEQGYIYLCDRAKDMLIVGGFKVFSVELEDKLASLEGIAQSAVVGTADEKRGGNDIVNLYVELTAPARQRDAEQVKQEILDFCHANMSAYKIPKVIHLIDQLPMTAVGKIDKKKLRDLATIS